MRKEIKTEIRINATPAKVWAILTDFEKHPNWNPLIKFIKGDVAVGKKITVRIEPHEMKGMTFSTKVRAFEKHKEFRWKGHLLFPGLFDGEHKFELIDNGDGTTTFKHGEKFNGILVLFFKKMIEKNTTHGFHLMNQKLKELAES
jgi:hypothetical protein